MNTLERTRMIKAMEFIARQINDEDVFEGWLIGGVADGDIRYGDLDTNLEDIEDLECYFNDEDFADLMNTFLNVIARAKRSGGFYCDGVVSKEAQI